jgi:hypothetical protein
MRGWRSMSNVLKVSRRRRSSLADRGWSQRRIARELGINRETVGRYLLLRDFQNQPFRHPALKEIGKPNPAISTSDVDGSGESKPGHFERRRRSQSFGTIKSATALGLPRCPPSRPHHNSPPSVPIAPHDEHAPQQCPLAISNSPLA